MIKYAVVEDNQVTETFTGLPLSWRNTSGFNLIGDDVEVLDVKGKVEKVGLRITTVREKNGTLWYLRNGEILKVGNKSQSG